MEETGRTAAPEAVFVAHGLTKIYRNADVEVKALRGVDIALYEREISVLLGPSGSGKSTLLNILGGLDTATSGDVRFRDRFHFNPSINPGVTLRFDEGQRVAARG